MHDCTDCGLAHETPAEAESEAPVIVEAEPGPNENDVKIAEIEAGARVETEKIYAEQNDTELRAEVERLRGEMTGMRETLDRLAPEPDPAPEPVVVPVPEPAPESPAEPAPAPPEAEPKEKPAEKKKGFF